MLKVHFAFLAFLAGGALRVYDEHLRLRMRKLEGSFNAVDSERLTALLSRMPRHYNWLMLALLYLWPEKAVRMAKHRMESPGS